MTTFDVYAFGVIAPSILYLLKDKYPSRSGYAEFETKYKNIGGEAANSSIVLSRLGAKVKLDGNWINPDEDADLIQEVFGINNIDISCISLRECTGPKEMLVVDSDTRTIFGTYAQLMKEESWNLPKEEDIQNTKIICLDPFFGDASQLAAKWAVKHHKPVVTVDCKYDDPIFTSATVTIISAEYLRDTYAKMNIDTVIEEYKARSNGTIIFTFGHEEIIYGFKNKEFNHFTPYQIKPIDTTGAGDSFRGGIIYGLLQDWTMKKTISFASAVAALVCLSYPGVLNSPNLEQVLSFIDHSGTKA